MTLMLRRTLLSLLACSAPMTLMAQQPDSPLASICNSGRASLQSLQSDPLLSQFFEVTCGKTLQAALQDASVTPSAPLPSPPVAAKTDDNGPVMSSPMPQAPALRVDPGVARQPSESKIVEPPTPQQSLVFKEIELRGVTVAAPDALKASLQEFIGKPITLVNLDKLTQSIQTWYRAQGYLARTLLPGQDLTEGRLLINVVESQFTGAVINDPKGLLRNTQLPKRLVESKQPVGKPVNLEQLETAAASLRDLSGVETSVQLTPGAQEGETKAVVNVAPAKPVELQVSADNHGSKGTGEDRVSAHLRINNLSRRGDTFTASLMKSDGLEYAGVGYDLPFTTSGWRVEARAAQSEYRLVDPVFSAADMRGPTRNIGTGLIVPLVRDGRNSVNFQTSFDSNRYENRALGSILSRYQSRLLGAQIDGQHIDRDGRGQSQWAIQLSRGELDLSDSPAFYQLADATGAQTAGYFSKARVSASRRHWVNPRNSLTLRAQAQWADKNLDGSEKFYLGGARGVRAYPTNEGGGSLGRLASLEWESQVYENPMGKWAVAAFYDHGSIRRFQNPNPLDTSQAPNDYSLHGYGLWVGTQGKLIGGGLLGMRLTFARRLGSNAGATNGLDSDGSRVDNRIRLDANLAF
jgi:hemolysin activation/secretion protein